MVFHGGQFQQELCVSLQSWDCLPCGITSCPHSASYTYLSTDMLEISVTYHLFKSFYSLFIGSVSAPFFFLGPQCQFTWNFLAFILGNTLPRILTYFPWKSHCPSLYHDLYVWVTHSDTTYSILGKGRRQNDFFVYELTPKEEACVLSVCIPQCRIRNLQHAFFWP